MDYHLVDTDAIDPEPDRSCTRRSLSEPAGLSRMAINRYTAQPGEQIPRAYHFHDEQEEAFYVLSGTLHVDTPEGSFEVGADSLFTVAPGSPQYAYNPADADEAVEVVAVGAPPAPDDTHVYQP
jgi:mannose-6-phosphate isomerase-like protein (cupin superfamily)